MSAEWPMVPLGEIIQHRKEFIQIDNEQTYKRCRVQLHANGIVLRDEVKGSEIKTKKQQVVKTNEFLVAEIDAKLGGFGVVPDDLEEAIVSSHYFLYQINEALIDRRFFEYYIRTPAFRDQVGARGSTNYAAIRPHHVLAYITPLPPLSEQRRIVGRLAHLASKIEEARGLRARVEKEVTALLASTFDQSFLLQDQWRELRVSEICEQPQYGYTASATDQPIGPKMVRITDIQDGKVNWNSVPFCNCPEPKKYLLQKDDILFARTGGTTGKSFLISQECPESVFASYLIRLRVKQLVTPSYLYKYFQSPSYWTQITDGLSGTGQPNVNGKKLTTILVPIPPIQEQYRIVEKLDSAQAKVDSLKQLQAQTRGELDALLPSVLDKAFRGEL